MYVCMYVCMYMHAIYLNSYFEDMFEYLLKVKYIFNGMSKSKCHNLNSGKNSIHDHKSNLRVTPNPS